MLQPNAIYHRKGAKHAKFRLFFLCDLGGFAVKYFLFFIKKQSHIK